MKISTGTILLLFIFFWSARAEELDRGLENVLNATFTIEKSEVHLINGRSQVLHSPGSATKIITEVFKEPVFGDLNGDGLDDAALILVQDPGGSGAFFYAAAAIRNDGGYHGTNAVLLGDRIIVRTLQIQTGIIVAGFLERQQGDPMAEAPSILKTVCMKLNEGRLEAAPVNCILRN